MSPAVRHVVVNALFLQPRMGGMEAYVRRLLPELVALAPDVRFTLLTGPAGQEALAGEPWLAEVELSVHPVAGRRGLRAIGELGAVGALAARRGADVLHSVALIAPLWSRAASVLTVADVTWMVHSDPADRWTTRLWRVVVPPGARRADRVLAISQAGADDIATHLGVDRDRIDVVPLGHGGGRAPAPTPGPELRRRLGIADGPLVLSVSAKRVHKNLGRLIEAMPAVRERVPGAVLVLPGNPTPHEAELRALARRLGLDGQVAFPAYVDAADLEGLYAEAGVMAFPSLNEGFGLPVLEAMRRGVPVACADASALPEVAGDAALLFDPHDAAAIADAVVRALRDGPLRTRLTAAGRERQAQFTWRRTAEGTLEVYQRAVRARR